MDQHPVRFSLMALAGLSLLAALWGGVVRLGWNFPVPTLDLPAHHGVLMVVGFLGTLISLERAVALKRLWPHGAPLLSALSALMLLFGAPLPASQILAIAAALLLVLVFVSLCYQHPSDFLLTMGFGALLWFIGNLLWCADYPFHQIVPWWIGFLVLTIAGERLELSRLIRLSPLSRALFFFAVSLFLFGLGVGLFVFVAGVRLSALALLLLALWLLRCDIAWRTIRQVEMPRYMAVCLLSGYIWLGIGGALWFFFADLFLAGRHYDAMLHSIFLGFVFSMIFAHAPIILPSVTGLAMPFQRLFYSQVVLLHLSLLLRVGGDLIEWKAGQRWGGLLNALTILLFLANNMRSVRAGLSGTS